MLTDLLLAIAHHLLIFALFGVLVAEMVIVRQAMTAGAVLRASRLDSAYGILAGLILLVGFGRVFFGLKGAAFYLGNPVFWAKIGAFAAVALLSAVPTIRLLRWRKEAKSNPDFVPAADEIRNAKLFMHMEAVVFALIPIFAAMLARGYGN
jgi:putative membrane protein